MNYEDILFNKFAGPSAVIVLKDDSLRIVDINDKFLSELWMNIDKNDYITADFESSFDDKNLQLFKSAVKLCCKTGEEQYVETWRNLTSDCCGIGKICLKSRLNLFEASENEFLLYETVANVTNEKTTMYTLEDIEHRYKQTSEQINIYNWEYTIATKEMRPCYRCMRDLGLPALVKNYPDTAIDMGIFPPDYADMYRDMMRRIDEGEKELVADIPLTVSRTPFRVKYTTEFDEDGMPIKAFGSATLISETELGQIKLDNQIISTLAQAYCCIFLVDFVSDSVKIIKHNEPDFQKDEISCKELTEMIANRLSGVKDLNINHIKDINHLRTKLFNDSDRREFVYKDEENNQWIRMDYHIIERGINSVDRLLITSSILDDYSAQKLDDDRLIAEQKAELENRQNKLIAATEEATRANRAKTIFFSNMSHDIRTPMSAITGFSELAMEEIDDREKLTDYLDKIINASGYLMNLINDILDMSRIESGKMELQTADINLKNLMFECADMVRGEMRSRKLHFIFNANDMGSDMVKCDKLRFRQIILNLLSNAYKFTPEGGIVFLNGKLLDRGSADGAAPGQMLTYEIHVKDTGIGMSEEFSKHIWDAYSREKSDKVHETQGTGLGMAIVKRIVDLMQGTIVLETTPGKGSEFIITLPLERAEGAKTAPASAKAKATPSAANSDVNATDQRFDGKTLLVVDDTDMNLKLAQIILRKFGFTVLTVQSGEEAIEKIRHSSAGDIDLILMDVMMPSMDGLETTRRIRAMTDAPLSGIPIIAMTANVFESDIQKALDAGMDGHVPKPFVKDELIARIAAHLS